MDAHDWAQARDDAEQAEYLLAWKQRKGCLHWLCCLTLTLGGFLWMTTSWLV